MMEKVSVVVIGVGGGGNGDRLVVHTSSEKPSRLRAVESSFSSMAPLSSQSSESKHFLRAWYRSLDMCVRGTALRECFCIHSCVSPCRSTSRASLRSLACIRRGRRRWMVARSSRLPSDEGAEASAIDADEPRIADGGAPGRGVDCSDGLRLRLCSDGCRTKSLSDGSRTRTRRPAGSLSYAARSAM